MEELGLWSLWIGWCLGSRQLIIASGPDVGHSISLSGFARVGSGPGAETQLRPTYYFSLTKILSLWSTDTRLLFLRLFEPHCPEGLMIKEVDEQGRGQCVSQGAPGRLNTRPV